MSEFFFLFLCSLSHRATSHGRLLLRTLALIVLFWAIQALITLATLYEKARKPLDAVACYKQALQFLPIQPHIFSQITRNLLQLHHENPSSKTLTEAEDWLSKLVFLGLTALMEWNSHNYVNLYVLAGQRRSIAPSQKFLSLELTYC